MAKSFCEDRLGQTRTADKLVKEVIPVSNENGELLLYIINYESNGGYVIVSAKRDYMPILAYNDEGNFDLNTIGQSNAEYWFQLQKRAIGSVAELPDSLKCEYRRMWSQYAKQKVAVNYLNTTRGSVTNYEVGEIIERNLQKWSNEGYDIMSLESYLGSSSDSRSEEILNAVRTYGNDNFYGGAVQTSFVLMKDYSYTESVPSLLKSKWDQGYGFNQFIPNNYPTGCVTIALGQIMRYHEYPSRYNWSDMPYSGATETTARFLREVGDYANVHYDKDGSSGSYEDACSALNNNLGYTQARIVSHDNSTVCQELRMRRPVYMRGYDSSGFLGFKKAGHAWVCDGFNLVVLRKTITVMCLQNCPIEYAPDFITAYPTFEEAGGNLYMSMNWGWRGEHNGYYAGDDVSIPNDEKWNFIHERRDIINITPN